jgi:hypothetical protein
LSQLDLSCVDFLNSNNVQHSPLANLPSSPPTLMSPVANSNFDPDSGTGLAFFVEENAYCSYLNDWAKKSSCANLAALYYANSNTPLGSSITSQPGFASTNSHVYLNASSAYTTIGGQTSCCTVHARMALGGSISHANSTVCSGYVTAGVAAAHCTRHLIPSGVPDFPNGTRFVLLSLLLPTYI